VTRDDDATTRESPLVDARARVSSSRHAIPNVARAPIRLSRFKPRARRRVQHRRIDRYRYRYRSHPHSIDIDIDTRIDRPTPTINTSMRRSHPHSIDIDIDRYRYAYRSTHTDDRHIDVIDRSHPYSIDASHRWNAHIARCRPPIASSRSIDHDRRDDEVATCPINLIHGR
jgi:hypothetical protein